MWTMVVSMVFASCVAGTPPAPPIGAAMQRLKVPLAILVASRAVDEHPVWSADGRFLAVNVDGRWSKVDLGSVTLVRAAWNGQEVGVAKPAPPLVGISEAEVHAWEKNARSDPRRVVTRSGTVAELDSTELGTTFRVTKEGAAPTTRWKTSLENCHGLALSPDGSLVAFVCELHGVMVEALGA